jgi:hypothetical protein
MRYAAVVVCTILIAINGYSQSWHAPYDMKSGDFTPDSQSVGYLLEPVFNIVLQQCGQGDFRSLKEGGFLGFGKKDVPKSSIPPKLQVSPGLDLTEKWKATFKNESLGQAFAYLYTADDIRDFSKVQFNHSRRLNLESNPAANASEYGVVPNSFLPNAVFDAQHNFIYTSSCDSILSAAASQKSGITLPAASFQESFSGAYNFENKDTLVLVRGENFYSPIGFMLDTPSWSGYAKLLLWSLYGRPGNTGISARDNYYIHDAPALAIVQSARSRQDVSGDLKLGASASLPYLTVDASFRAALSSSDSSSFDWSETVLLDSSQNPVWPVLVPDVRDMAASFRNTLRLKSASMLIKGTNTITATAPGVPRFLCNAGVWDVGLEKPNISGATVDFKDNATVSDPEVATDPPNCIFSLAVAIPTDLDVTQHPSFNATIDISLKQQLTGKDNQSHQLVLTGTTGDVSLSGSPIIDLRIPYRQNFAPSVNALRPDEHDLVWTRDIQITDDGADPIDLGRGVSIDNGATMHCKDDISGFSVEVLAQPGAQNPHTVTLKATRSIIGTTTLDLSGDPASLNVETCTISVTAKLYMSKTGRLFSFRVADWNVKGPTPPQAGTGNPTPPPR